jgi:hypothetical protein
VVRVTAWFGAAWMRTGQAALVQNIAW